MTKSNTTKKNQPSDNVKPFHDTISDIEQEEVIKQPSKYKVLLLNDDFTPMDFVIEILQKYFRKDVSEATHIMLEVHHKGMGECGVYPYEIAEMKILLVEEYARQYEHPLRCRLEVI